MADLIRTGSGHGAVMKDKLGSPSTGSEDGNEQDAQGAAKAEPDETDLGDSAPFAPSETLWYHGRLDRYQAEERLWLSNKLGSYLVRESDRKPGSYVLSFLGRTGMNHFRITAVCGDFYIGGRQFVSLNDLVGYYTERSDLLKRERLVHPVAPPEPVNDKKRVVAILPYTKMPDTDELTFKKGDIFFVHNDMGNGWLWVTAHRTGEQGMIFRELVEDLDDSIDPNTVFPWFHPNCTKNEAVDLLVKAGPGSFLVRPSDNSPGDYSLFFHINNQIQRFRIEKKGVRYLMGGRIFECLDAVINRYKKEQIVEGYTLQHPVSKYIFFSIYQTAKASMWSLGGVVQLPDSTLQPCFSIFFCLVIENLLVAVGGRREQTSGLGTGQSEGEIGSGKDLRNLARMSGPSWVEEDARHQAPRLPASEVRQGG
jgi:Ras GTPase-activating protein 1